MKKSLFTLLAVLSAFLFSTGAMAQVIGDPVLNLTKSDNTGAFMLVTKGNVEAGKILYLEAAGGDQYGVFNYKLGADDQAFADKNLGNALWCVNVEHPASSSFPQFIFTNRGAKSLLELDLNGVKTPQANAIPAKTGASDVFEWKYLKNLSNINYTLEEGHLISYVATDVIAYLANDGGNVVVKVVKADTDITADALSFELRQAERVWLSAEAFNSYMKLAPEGKLELFKKDVYNTENTNYFINEGGLYATKSTVANVGTATGDFLNLQLNDDDDKGQYIRVARTKINSVGEDFLDFSTEKAIGTTPGEFAFRVWYEPSKDIIEIESHSSVYPAGGSNKGNRNNEWVSYQDLREKVKSITVGTPTIAQFKFGIGDCVTADDRTTLASDVYVIKHPTKANYYLAVPIFSARSVEQDGWDADRSLEFAVAKWVDLTDSNVDPKHQPAFQWVVEKTRETDKSAVSITNREYPEVTAPFSGAKQFYVNKGIDITVEVPAGTIEHSVLTTDLFIPVGAINKSNARLGYAYIHPDTAEVVRYEMQYLNTFGQDNKIYLGLKDGGKDEYVYVDYTVNTKFTLIPQLLTADETKYAYTYGYASVKAGAKQLVRTAYVLRVNDSNKLGANHTYITRDVNNDRYSVTDDIKKATKFYLKENNHKAGAHFYALVDLTDPRNLYKAGIDEDNTHAKINHYVETRTSAFALVPSDDPLYRTYKTNDDIVADCNVLTGDTLVFYNVNEKDEVLYESSNRVDENGKPIDKNKEIGYLGIRNENLLATDGIERSTSLFVQPVHAAVKGDLVSKVKPQYLISVRSTAVCDETIVGTDPCNPSETLVPGYQHGWFLTNTIDRARVDGSNPKSTIANHDYIWNTQWERLAFIEGIKIGHTLYLFDDKYVAPMLDLEGYEGRIDVAKVKAAVGEGVEAVALNNNSHKDIVWQFRLINDSPKKDFLMETESEPQHLSNTLTTAPYVRVAPVIGGWIKVQNNVPVISRGSYENAITEALVFNTRESSDDPVSNENISTTDVVVVAGNGNVQVLNAAGKTVTITNILGQTVANQILTSDNATVAVPQGIVIVSVDGQAVKALVK